MRANAGPAENRNAGEARRRAGRAAVIVLALAALAGSARAREAPGPHPDIAIAGPSLLSRNAAIVDRLLSPLAAEGVRAKLAAAGKMLPDRAFDPTNERFTLYIPPAKPPGGYGLLVFVPPWPRSGIPPGWRAALDRLGFIWIAADRSGNDQSVLSRRAPLALFATDYARRAFEVDPARVFIGGFSGGSRVAQRLALAYPDVYRGALLDAGSDPIGAPPNPLPAAESLLGFQARSRVVYLTGAKDPLHLAMDAASMASMRKWCVFDYVVKTPPFLDHDPAGEDAFADALVALVTPARPDVARLNRCRAERAGEADRALAHARDLISRGDRAGARRALLAIDASLGGFAAPRSVELARRCGCALIDSSLDPRALPPSGERLRAGRERPETRSPRSCPPPHKKHEIGGEGPALLIVGIGASAGGLDAFKSFFAATRPDSGMAFVLVQHLAPDYKSLLAELLGKTTDMSVVEAADGDEVVANRVFVIPPDATMTIRGGRLAVVKPAPPRERRRPIDTFMQSLAEDQGENAVCIILSGTGSDGAL
ncbi:MAG: chemotaxis protein CheB, partial [Caulobacteraceae bacterium]